MKKLVIKFVAFLALLSINIGLIFSANNTTTKVEAAQYIDDYDAYYYDGNYYDSIDFDDTEGMNGALRQALTSLIRPKGFYEYGSSGSDHLSTQLQYADQDPTNSANMIYLYTRDSVKKNAASSWNREHVWPQSLSNDNWGTDKGGTDILHIRPTYNSTNSARGNLLYGDNNKSGPVKYNDMLYGYTGGKYFEPLDQVKGDVARIIMYMWTAYTGYTGYSPLSITSVFQSYDVLLKWHTLDKPDALEGNRNNYAQTSIQKNRNPFVDHPELAWKIFGNEATSSVKSACMEAYPGDGSSQQQKQLTSIQLSGEPLYKEYYAGQSFNPTGLTVTAFYNDGSSKEVSTSNCSWTPDPLVEGTTSVTCKYGNCTATYSGITVSKRDSVGGEYSVEFLKTSDSGTDISSSTISSYWKNNTLVDRVSDLSKVFPGESGLKLGSSSANGKITFHLVNNAQANIAQIVIETTSFKGNGAFSAKLDNELLSSSTTAGVKLTKTLNCASGTKITIESNGRMYINSITVLIDNPTPPQTSSSVPSSMSNVPSSEPQIISSSKPFDESSLHPGDPYTTSYQNISFSGMSGGYIEPVSSVASDVSTPSSSNEENKKSASGCAGSVIGVSFFTLVSALIGFVFIASKKK